MKNEPSRTAEWVCLYRAAEQRREEASRALTDPYAKLFLGPLTRAALATLEATGKLGRMAEELAVPGLSAFVVARHRFIDDRLEKALDAGVEQVVLLGAGYDTRAYRFADRLGERRVFEVDFPATSRRKAEIVDQQADRFPKVDVQRVEIDFLSENVGDVLRRSGFEEGRSTFFVWEGVSMYLTRAAIKDTLTTLRQLGGDGSVVAMDYWFLLDQTDLLSALRRATPNLLYFLGEPITFAIHPEDVLHFLARLGFEVDDLADQCALETRYLGERGSYPACYVLSATRSDPPTP